MLKLTDKQLYALLIFIVIITLAVFGGYKLFKESESESEIEVEGVFNFLIIIGVLFGIIKFASKVSLGCSFSNMKKIETATVAVVYFCIPLIISLIIDILGSALGEVMGSVADFNVVIGASQATVSVILLVFGLYTVRMWTKNKKNITKKTSIFMVFPCPGTLLTMFTTSALLIITGIDSLLVGLLIGGIFVAFIFVGDFAIKKTKIKRDPSSFGGVMIFFGILYVFSVLFVPAYIPVSQMDIPIEVTPFEELLPGVLFMMIAILIGAIFEHIHAKKRYEVR